MSPRKLSHPINHLRIRGGIKAAGAKVISLAVLFSFFLGLLLFFRHDQLASSTTFSSTRTSTSSASFSPHISLREYTPLTTLPGASIPGYHVFSNLYLHEGSYLAITDSPESLPEQNEIVRATNVEVKTRWKVIRKEDADELGDVVGVLDGVTMIFNDPPGPAGYLAFHTNFLSEAFAGALKVLGTAPPLSSALDSMIPKRIIFPNCGEDVGWRDDKDLNPWLLTTAFPSTPIEERSTFSMRASAGLPVILERAVIVDRWSAHSKGGEPGKWGKMNAGVANLRTPLEFFEPIRLSMMAGLGIEMIRSKLPVVVYLNNQDSGRRLNPGDHESLIKALKTLINIAEIHVVKMGDMKVEDRIGVVSKADIILSTHDDRLYNQMWMQATHTSTVIEIFDDGSFIPDQWLFSKLLGHHYIAFHNDHVYEDIVTAGRVEKPDYHGGNWRVDSKALVETIRQVLVDPAPKFDQ